jgi:hypothetical protein
MIAKAFFYTNVLVYAAVGAGKDEPKRKRAMELVESMDFGTGVAGILCDQGWSAQNGACYDHSMDPANCPRCGSARTVRTPIDLSQPGVPEFLKHRLPPSIL